MSELFQISRIPIGAKKVSLVREAGPDSGEGTSFLGGPGWTFVPHSLAGREGPHWDSQDYINTWLSMRGRAKTFYLDFQDLVDAGWAKLTLYVIGAPDDKPAAPRLDLAQIGWVANTKHTYIACEFDHVVPGMRLHVRTSGAGAPGPAAANGYAVVGMRISQKRCPDGIKRKQT